MLTKSIQPRPFSERGSSILYCSEDVLSPSFTIKMEENKVLDHSTPQKEKEPEKNLFRKAQEKLKSDTSSKKVSRSPFGMLKIQENKQQKSP